MDEAEASDSSSNAPEGPPSDAPSNVPSDTEAESKDSSAVPVKRPSADTVAVKRRNQQYNRRKWKKIQQTASQLVSSVGPSVSPFIVMRLNQGVLEWGGPSFMRSFVEDDHVLKRFKEAALNRPSGLLGSDHESRYPPPPSAPSGCNTPSGELSAVSLRRVITCACNPKHEKGFWTSNKNRPCWWPQGIPFQSPNWVSGSQQRLNIFQLSCVYDAYASHQAKDSGKPGSPTTQAETPNEPTTRTESPNEPPNEPPNEDQALTDLKTGNYGAVLGRLSRCSWQELEALCQDLYSSLPPPMAVQITDASQLPMECKIDYARTKLRQLPAGFVALMSSGDGNCLFHSLSLLCQGTEDYSLFLRMAATIYGVCHVDHYIAMYLNEFDDVPSACAFMHMMTTARSDSMWGSPKDIIAYTVKEEAAATAKVGSYSGILQVLFTAGYLNVFIQQHCEEQSLGYDTHIHPCPCQEEPVSPVVHVMWVKASDHGPMNHFVPLVPRRGGSRRKHLSDPLRKRDVEDVDLCIASVLGMCQGDRKGTKLSTWIQCDKCKAWYHCLCTGVALDLANHITFKCCVSSSERASMLDGTFVTVGDLNRLRDIKDVSGDSLDFFMRHLMMVTLEPNRTCALPYFVGQVLDEGSWMHSLEGVELQQRMLQHLRHGLGMSASCLDGKTCILVPVCIQNHWIGIIANKESQRLLILDSLQGHLRPHVYQQLHQAATRYLNLISQCAGTALEYCMRLEVCEVPQQDNSHDCGLYVLAYMEAFVKEGIHQCQQLTGKTVGRMMRRRLLRLSHDNGVETFQ